MTRYLHEASGNVTSIADAAGNVQSFTYEPIFNWPTSTTDPLGHTTRFDYSAQGDLTTIIDPLGNVSTRTYDQVSRLISQIDPRGKTTTFAYDPLNRLMQLVDARNGQTRFTYDGNGNLLTVTDALNHTITHTYDSMDRLATRTDPLGRVETFSFDPAGNLMSTTDRKGQTTTFSYDALNRRVKSTFADGTSSSFTYDAAGRLMQSDDTADPHRPISLTYDALDRLVTETTALGTVSYEYDPLGRRTQMAVSGQSPVSYSYDAASRLRAITQAPLNPVDIQYDPLGRRTKLTLPNGVSTESQYDAASRLTALIYRNATGLFGDLTYTYDAAGNRTGVGGSFARTLLPDAVPSATRDAANRQQTFGDKTMTYDANGNLTSITDPSGVTTFTWDGRNRLVNLHSPGATAAFGYDAFGRRAAKTINNQTTQYLYDGLDILRELQGGTDVPYLRSLTIDEPYVRNGNEFYLADTLGSILGLSDATSALATRYIYDPFGSTTLEGAPSVNPFQYTGRENDGTGLYYYRARYYSTMLHRFVSEDPIRLIGGGVSRYAYVGNNPLMGVDPLGLLNFVAGVGGSAMAITGVEASGGVAFNPGVGGQPLDVGLFESVGIGGGVNVGADAFAGVIFGGLENVSGKTINTNFTLGPVSVTVLFDPNTGELLGGTFGLGPSALPFQGSLTGSFTGTFTLRDIVRSFFKMSDRSRSAGVSVSSINPSPMLGKRK